MSSSVEFQRDIFQGYSDDCLATYLFQLPFGLGFDPDQTHSIQQTSLEGLTQGIPEIQCVSFVNFRFARIPSNGERFLPEGINHATRLLYGTDLPVDNTEGRFASDYAYKLWVSTETPLAKLPGERDMPARTLERCFRALDILLRAYRMATGDPSVYPMGPAGVNKTVPVGVRDTNGQWHFLMALIMRAESGIPNYPTSMTSKELSVLGALVQGLSMNSPFLRGRDLELTSFRQAYALDDLPSAVVSLQTAVESTLFQLWHQIMVDLDMTRSQIDAETQSDKPFKTLLTSILPSLLGGRWDINAEQTPVGRYWRDLYLLRNEVVHSGANVQEWQLDKALSAHRALIRHVAERLLVKWRKYPRTMAAFGNARGFPPGLSREAQRAMVSILSEPRPYWWPPEGGAE